jgi:hypothetical protein
MEIEQFFQTVIPHEKFKQCHKFTLIELNDYINLRDKGIWNKTLWECLKHSHIFESGRTIWWVTEEFLNSQKRPIGVNQAPLAFYKYIYSELEKLGSFYA